MPRLKTRTTRLSPGTQLRDDRGATVIEYGLIAVLVGVTVIIAMFLVRDALLNVFSTTVNAPGVTVCPSTNLNCTAYSALDPKDIPSASASGAVPPNVVTHAATNVEVTSAVLNGVVNANGFPTSAVGLRYSTVAADVDGGLGMETAVNPPQVTGTSDTAIAGLASPLLPNTTYYYRASAANSGGPAAGFVVSFTTKAMAPTVTTEPATDVTGTTALLHATVNANGSTTSNLEIRYSTDKAVVDSGGGSQATPVPAQATGTTATAVNANLTGLAPGTIYYFRATASNSAGTAAGITLSFRTSAACQARTDTVQETTGSNGQNTYTIDVLSGETSPQITAVTPDTNKEKGNVTISTDKTKFIWRVSNTGNTWNGTYTYTATSCTGTGTGTLTLGN